MFNIKKIVAITTTVVTLSNVANFNIFAEDDDDSGIVRKVILHGAVHFIVDALTLDTITTEEENRALEQSKFESYQKEWFESQPEGYHGPPPPMPSTSSSGSVDFVEPPPLSDYWQSRQ